MNKCKYHFKHIHTNFSEHHIKTYVLTYIISMIILGGGGGEEHWGACSNQKAMFTCVGV